MTIRAKFAGSCAICHAAIAIGDNINWERGQRPSHVKCPTGALAQANADALALATGSVRVTVTDGPVVAVSRPVVGLSGLVAFLKAARDRGLKFPKTRFAAPGNGELLISLAGDTSRNPGAVYVKLNGEYAGKVTAAGVADRGLDALLPTLRAIEADPAAAGAAYGALTGRCSFCGLGLTDEGSVEVGYGPVCAKRYGLPHSPKGSAKVVPVVNATPAPVADKVAAWVQVADAAYDAQFPVAGPVPTWRLGGTLSARVNARIDDAVAAAALPAWYDDEPL